MNKGRDNFEEELLKIQKILHQFAYKLTGNYDKANDLMQDTILKALVNREKYVADNNFKGWVVTIMRNILTHRLGLFGDEFKTCRLWMMKNLKDAAGMTSRAA